MDDRFDDLLRAAARDYNKPPETPRDVMWSRIVAERADRAEAEAPAQRPEPKGRMLALSRFRSSSYFRLAAGVAAILALGIGLGRLSVDRPQQVQHGPDVSSESPRVNAAAYQVVTTEHLSQAEAFLTLFRASVRGGGDQRLASATARQLLATNRLLLDSPAARDTRTRLLLQDLELVLAEIAQLSAQPRDLELVTDGLERGGVLPRLRTAVPAGASATQGVL
jgi:hypothetical protein